MPRSVVLYTGGKDSHTALVYWLRESSLEDVVLLNIRSSREDLMLFHTINSRWTEVHADLIGASMYVFEIGGDEVEGLRAALSKIRRETGARYIVTGAVASNYQKRVFDTLARELDMVHVTPLWQREQEGLLREEVLGLGIGFVIVAAQAMGLSEEWVGREVSTERDVEELIEVSRRYMFSPVGEGGEYESYVVSSPLFRGRRLRVYGRKVWYPAGWGYLYIERVSVEKAST